MIQQHPLHPALFLSLPVPPTNNNQPATLAVLASPSMRYQLSTSHLLSIFFYAQSNILLLYFLTSRYYCFCVFYFRILHRFRWRYYAILRGFWTGEAFLWLACERKASLRHQSQRKKHVLFKK